MAPLPLPDGTCEDTEKKTTVDSEGAMVRRQLAAYSTRVFVYPLVRMVRYSATP